MLGVTAFGVICYGIYCAVVALNGSLGPDRGMSTLPSTSAS
ncbi:MAG: hypothetical protein H0W43_10000 [Chthoniobacterales bacterium]|nr:hypothetical protein [Chthoniobacterales bacterium]